MRQEEWERLVDDLQARVAALTAADQAGRELRDYLEARLAMLSAHLSAEQARVAALTAERDAAQRENEANYAAFRLEHECRNAERDAANTRVAALTAALEWHMNECEDCGCTAKMRAALAAAKGT